MSDGNRSSHSNTNSNHSYNANHRRPMHIINDRQHVRHRSFKYLVIYDFDGTVYATRLVKYMKKQGMNQVQQQQYIDEKSNLDLIREWGGSMRIQALKMHFEKL